MNSSKNEDICEKYGIKNYTINDDGTIDVNGDVDLSNKQLTKLPLKFGKVTGYFLCDTNKLTSLEGCPTYVGGGFLCFNNKLTSLEGCPNYVGGNFSCINNKLTSLEGCPKEVGGEFWCGYNPLPKEAMDNPKAHLKELNRNKKLDELLNDQT